MPRLASVSQCTGCTACISICPQNCIQMKEDDAGFAFPEIIDQSSCIACGLCERICPMLTNKKCDRDLSTVAYAAFSKNNSLRFESSSGGIFSELASVVLDLGGIVYGASYDEKGVVRHIGIESYEKLEKLRGAKYSQSILGNTFRLLKNHLDSGKAVLFSGTPCQVVGLRAFLRKDYDKLICLDFVCHGIPSPMVWKKYVGYRAHTDNNEIYPQRINMRNKESGWSRYSYSVEFLYSEKNRYLCKNNNDLFMNLFVNDYILRKSCSACNFKGYSRISDITLGDFWGIWNIDPNMDDNKGTSLVLIHSSKGKELFGKILKDIKIKKVTLEQASRENPSLISSSKHKWNRDQILNEIFQNGFQTVEAILKTEKNGENKLQRLYRNLLGKLSN